MPRWLLLALAPVPAVTMMIASPAGANFSGATGDTGCDGGVNMADNDQHTFRFEDLTSTMQSATTYAMDYSIDPTALNALMDSTPDSNTDVWATDTYYTSLCGRDWFRPGHTGTGTTVGLYTCEDTTSADKCQHAKVRYNNHWTDTVSTSYKRGLACHETGHSLGLLHREGDGCMHQGYPKDGLVYSAHDQVHLTDNY